jgi:type IV secretory pathway VirB10-like protein
MPEATQTVAQLVPDPEALKPAGLSNKHKRYIYFGVTGVLALLILANFIGSHQGPVATRPKQTAPGQPQNSSPTQIRDWENSLKQAEAQLEQEQKDREQQLALARASQTAALTPEEQLQQAEALQEAAAARQQYQQTYGNGGAQNAQAQQKSQVDVLQEQQAFKSLFADNMVRQQSTAPSNPKDSPVPQAHSVEPAPARAPVKTTTEETGRKPLDFDPTSEPTLWLPEGTVIEAVLTNRLDGDAVGPVDCIITSDVYQPGTRVLLIPQGARVLGQATAVSSLGQLSRSTGSSF